MRALSLALAFAAIFLLVEGLPTGGKKALTTKAELRELEALLKKVESKMDDQGKTPPHDESSARKAPGKVFFQEKMGKSKAFKDNGMAAQVKTDCAPSYMGGDMGYFSSMNHGSGDYANNLDCTWVISGDAGEIITLSFISFDLEYYFDTVTVYNGNTANVLTGNMNDQTPFTFTSTDNYLTVVFHSDGSVTREGFSASYTIAAANTGGSNNGGSNNGGSNNGGSNNGGSNNGGSNNGGSNNGGSNNGGSSSGSYPDACLYAHNNVRSRHGVSDLVWDSDLAAESQVWADHLRSTDTFYHDSSNSYGENLYMGSVGILGAEYECSDAVFGWYDEVQTPGYDYAAAQFSSGTGHFTQVVWAATTKVGCATTTTNEVGTTSTSTIVCRYDPPGNYQGQFSSNVPQLTSGNSYPANLRELEANPCHDKSTECADPVAYGWCSTYDFIANVCYAACDLC